jgi:hypothetical protein
MFVARQSNQNARGKVGARGCQERIWRHKKEQYARGNELVYNTRIGEGVAYREHFVPAQV